ncbi:MAG: HepT-like ribonuclease domain-containing protein [Bacteroidota bacterium]
MNLEINKYLYDIKTSIDSILEYLGDKKDFTFYLSNKLLRRAVERELEIIGEAAGQLLKIDANFPIENARKIVDLRNWVIHGYDKVDDVIIWGIISTQLPKLQSQVEKLLQDNS